MIQTQVIFGALEVSSRMPAGAAQLEATSFGGRPVEMRQVIVIRFRIARRPVDHQPEFFQLRLAQVGLE